MIDNFDPTAATAEDVAFGAMTALENPTPEIEAMRPQLVDTLRRYADARKVRGLPLFPNRTAQANAKRNAYLRDLYVKPLDQVLPKESAVKLAQREALHPDPEGYRAREVNRAFLTAITGKPLTGASYDLTRDQYAKQHLGLSGDTSDKAVFNAIKGRHAEDDNDAANFSQALADGISKRLGNVAKLEPEGRTLTTGEIKGFDRPERKPLEWKADLAERDAILSRISERNRPAFRDKWNEANRELSRLFRKNGPLVEEMVAAVGAIRRTDQPEDALKDTIVDLAARLPDAREEREVALAMIGNALQNLPEDYRGALVRLVDSAKRGLISQGGLAITSAIQAQGRQAIEALPYGDPNTTGFFSDAATKRLQDASDLYNVITGNGMKLSKVTDNLFSKMAIAAAPSAWMFPAAFTPVGQAAIVESLTGSSVQKQARENPEVAEGLRTNAATASGMVQGAIESFTNVAGVKLMLGKLPRFAGLLNKAGIESAAGRAVLGFAAGKVTSDAIEYTEEAAQGATDMAFTALAQDLSGQKPDVDWGGYFKDWATIAGPEQKETLLAVSAFGMIAGAGASFNHFRYGSALARNKTFLRANGFTEAEVRDITNTTNLDEAAEKARAAFDLAQARSKEATQEEKDRLANLRAEAIEVLKASNEAYAAAGMPRVVKERNEFTEEDQWSFIEPGTGTARTFENEEDALGAWQDWNSAQSDEALTTIREAGEEGFLDFLTGEGQITEDVNVERVNKTVTPGTEQAAAAAEVKAAETDKRKAITPSQERAATARLDEAKTRMQSITKRIEIFLMERGIDPTNAVAAGRALDSVVIKAKSFATMLQGKVVGYTVELYNGAEIQDIAEDFAETAMKIAVEEGFADPEVLLDDIRRYEAATGSRIIDPGYEYDPGNRVPLIEGFSKLARAVLMGEVRSGALPREVSEWIETQAALMAVSVDLAKAGAAGSQFAGDVLLAGEWRRAVAEKKVPARLERLLKDSLGIDEGARMRRLEKRMEEQMAAEAMEGFPEISEVAKGRLPHPETLRENNHPLYGEVRRIWESLKKPTKRRTKQGRAVDRTNEANAYFLPVGEMEDLDNVRQAVNERGFAFDSITDMLDALDVSISYGKPFYGTASIEDESWAMGEPMSAVELGETLIDRIGEERLRLEQPRAKYEDKRQLLLDFAASIVGPSAAEGSAADTQERAGEGNLPGRLGRIQVIRQRLASDLAVNLKVDFIGATIDSVEDLATKAQALRNPMFETFYLIATKRTDQGYQILNSMAVTSRAPASAALFEAGKGWDEGMLDHLTFLEDNKADSYFLIHNHPSGDPSPSSADLRVTMKHAMDMAKAGYELVSHVVINHEVFSTIEKTGKVNSSRIPDRHPRERRNPYRWPTPGIDPQVDIGTTVESPEDLAALGKAVEADKADPRLLLGFVTNARRRVVATLAGTIEDFLALTSDQAEKFATSQGGTSLVIHGKAVDRNAGEEMITRLRSQNRKGVIEEVVIEHGNSYSSGWEMGLYMGTGFFGKPDPQGVRVQESWAMSSRGLMRLEDAIAKRMTRGPDERAEYFQRLRDRLAATVLQMREAKRNLATDQTDVERERARIRDAVAEASAIIKALPMEARGRVPFNINDVLDAESERGQINALIRLIDKADEALEVVLLKEYREAFETLLDLAKPDLRQNKQVRGRLTPETQDQVNRILAAVTLTPAELAVALPAKLAEIESLEATNPQTPEEIAASQKKLVELYNEQVILETFGAFSNLDAAATAHAYEQLQSIYVTGRTTRRILDEARKADIDAAKAELLSTLPEVDQAKHATRVADKGILDQAEALRLGMSSFHQVMEWIFPRSTVARDFQEKVRKADRAFTRAKIDAKERFDRYTYGVWNLSGVSRARKRNRILADLSTLRTDWNIVLQEGVKFATEKLTEDQAAAILDGTMKPGWESDPIAMTSLRQALADFRMQRLKAQQEDKRFSASVIKFQRLTNRGKPGAFVASDLQALYFLQLYAQEQYRPALDKFGFTESVMEAMERQINPKAKDLGDFLRDEYDAEWSRLNPVYRAIYGLNMPRIRNYAPGMFEHLDAKGGTDSTIDPYGNNSTVNAMSAGFTKARTHHMARPKQTNAMAGYWAHLEATEYFIAYAEIMRDARQIFRNPEVRRRIEGNFGSRVAGLWSQWLDALEVDGNFRAVQTMAMSEMNSKVLATQSAVGLAFNVGVLFKQTSAAFGVMMDMPTNQAVKGFVRALFNPQSLNIIRKSEAIQQRILAGMSPEDRKLLDAGRASPSILMELLEIGRLPIAYADATFTTLSAGVAYNYHLGEALKAGVAPAAAEASALAAATRVIERTAQPATTQDKSMEELTVKGFSKLLFMFKSDPRQKLAIVANAVAEYKAGRPGSGKKLARKAFWGWIAYGLMAEVMTDIWQTISRDDDDEERWAWQDYAAAMISGPISAIPLYGQSFDFLVKTALGGKAFQNAANPVEAGAGKLIPTTMKAIKLLTDEDEKADVSDIFTAAQATASAMALVAGGIDPRFAIAPAGLRLARDAWGTMTNMAALITEPTADDAALEIIRDIAKDEKTTRDGKAEANKALAKDLAKLDPATRQARLAKLDPDTRATITRKLRAASMTSSEMALDKLGKDARKQAVDKITAGMNETEARDYRERLKSLGLIE